MAGTTGGKSGQTKMAARRLPALLMQLIGQVFLRDKFVRLEKHVANCVRALFISAAVLNVDDG
jgi:hypothetical protein